MESTSFTRAAVTQLGFSVPPEPARLQRARDRIRDFLQQHCADQSVIDEVVLCVEEACTNVIRHSGSREEMRIALRFAADDLVAEVRDHGKGFDTGAFDPDAVPDVGAPGGRGLFLMAHLMDEVALTRARRARCAHGQEVRRPLPGGSGRERARRSEARRPEPAPRVQAACPPRGDRRGFPRPRLGLPIRARQREGGPAHRQVSGGAARPQPLGALPPAGGDLPRSCLPRGDGAGQTLRDRVSLRPYGQLARGAHLPHGRRHQRLLPRHQRARGHPGRP